MKSHVAVIALSGAMLMAQTRGTIDGTPIRESVFEKSDVCGALRAEITQSARDRAIKELAIVVTKADIDAYRRTVKMPDPTEESNYIRTKASLILRAFSLVDQGQDEHVVWQNLLKPNGVSEEEWKFCLTNVRTPKSRANLVKQLSMTPDMIAKVQANADFTRAAAFKKLDAAIDQELATQDPTFRAYLEHDQKVMADPDPHHHWMPVNEVKYMDAKRAEWWKAFTSKLDVRLNDPSLVKSCGLDRMGVRSQ